MSINRVCISGNLTRDPELRAIPTGSSVLSFSVAVNDRRKNQSSGEWEDIPNYIDCTLFGSRAEALAKYLQKGTKVCVEGKLRWSQWEDRETGKKRSKVEVIVDTLEFLTPRSGGGGGYEPVSESNQASSFGQNDWSTDQSSPAAPTAPSADMIPAAPEITVYDDDIPF